MDFGVLPHGISKVCLAFVGLAAAAAAVPTNAATVTLDFEGLQNLEPIGNFYNGGTGGSGSSGANLGAGFSANALAIIDEDAGGTGNIGGEPSPSTVMFFLTGTAATLNYAAGFDTGFSFYYSAINNPGSITVYDGLDATGTALATLALPLTPFNGAPDPTGAFSPLVATGISFSGTAKSIDFGGTINQIAFDNITFGSATPGGGGTPTPSPVPLPATLPMVLSALGAALVVRRRRPAKAA